VADNTSPTNGRSNIDRQRIVIVDDNLAVLEYMQVLLADEGYAVDTLNSTAGSHVRIKELKPDLLILDMVLETPDAGWQFLQTLKLDPQTRDIPIIVCSGATHLLKHYRERLDELDCYILPKPFTLDELVAMSKLAISEAVA
jgi:CheY-like chemotaxis protein